MVRYINSTDKGSMYVKEDSKQMFCPYSRGLGGIKCLGCENGKNPGGVSMSRIMMSFGGNLKKKRTHRRPPPRLPRVPSSKLISTPNFNEAEFEAVCVAPRSRTC